MKLPKSAKVNKVIPKTQFYNRVYVAKRLRDDFINKIKKIVWQYKLSEDTINISKTEKVEEIQIFLIELKEKTTPKNILQTIDKVIPYPILFVISFEHEKQYAISLKENATIKGYYFSEWNGEMDFDFSGTNLEKVYQKLIKNFIKDIKEEKKSFGDLVEIDNRRKELEVAIVRLEKKLAKEKQFNRKVEINKELAIKKKELNSIE
jgi:hypothetical protein